MKDKTIKLIKYRRGESGNLQLIVTLSDGQELVAPMEFEPIDVRVWNNAIDDLIVEKQVLQ